MNTGKKILVAAAGTTLVGGFLADWNKTHLLNPKWPPHAKFHDAMTISLGSFLGGASLYYLLRNTTDPYENLKIGTLLPAFFWSAQALSFAYPGAKGIEAEFPELIPRVKGVWLNEGFASVTMLTLIGTGYSLEQKAQKKQPVHKCRLL